MWKAKQARTIVQDFDQFDWERLAEAQQFLSSLTRKCLFCYMSGCASWFFPNRCGLMFPRFGACLLTSPTRSKRNSLGPSFCLRHLVDRHLSVFWRSPPPPQLRQPRAGVGVEPCFEPQTIGRTERVQRHQLTKHVWRGRGVEGEGGGWASPDGWCG